MQNKFPIIKLLKRYRLIRSLLKWILEFYFFLKNIFTGIFYCILSLILFKTIKIYLANHLTIGIVYLYKKKTKFPHPVGIVIGMKVLLGNHCTIYQNVTIGTKDPDNFLHADYPTLGNNVTIYPNSLILGAIKIGDNAVIGAGSLVLTDVPANTVVAGSPARIIYEKK